MLGILSVAIRASWKKGVLFVALFQITQNLPGQDLYEPLTLEECRNIALANQPAVRAANLSLAAGGQKAGALTRLGFFSRFSRSFPIRQQQAAWGVTAASAQAGASSPGHLF